MTGWLALSVVGAAVVLALPPLPAMLAVSMLLLVVALPFATSEEPAPVPRPEPPAADDVIRTDVLALLDVVAEGVMLLDEEQTVVAANRSAAALLGRPRESMAGVSLIRAARDYALLEVLREASGRPQEVTLADGRIVYATAAPVEEGEVRTVLTLQDLTSLRHAERARQDLMANVSHELRTPIAAAFALAETLEAGVEDEAHRARFLGQLTGEIGRLGAIVDRLLRLSRIESRVEEFHVEPVAVADLLSSARQRLAPVAERRAVEIEVGEVADGLRVLADREQVLEVLTNLVDNALRYSPAGGVVRLEAETVDGGMVRCSVRDHGPGILPRDRLRVFERFYTGDQSRAAADGSGTGLGLAIARHIVSRLGGEIWVADETPGATLCFTLPRATLTEG